VDTSSIKQQILNNLQTSKEYRQAFVEENIRARITAQIHALRTEKGWDYKQFAEKINKKTSWAYRLEDPNEAPPTIPSLLELADAFDVALDVRFRTFSQLLNDITTLTPTSFIVRSFESELKAGVFSKPRRGRKVRGHRQHRHKIVESIKRSRKHVRSDADYHRAEGSIGASAASDGSVGMMADRLAS